jgi:hypothetical protein
LRRGADRRYRTPAKPSLAAQPDAKRKVAATARPAPVAPAKPAAAAPRHPKPAAAPKTTSAAPKTDRNRAAVLSVLDAQERTANAFADYQARAAELSRIPGATTLANAQADLLRRCIVTYVKAARDLLT